MTRYRFIVNKQFTQEIEAKKTLYFLMILFVDEGAASRHCKYALWTKCVCVHLSTYLY